MRTSSFQTYKGPGRISIARYAPRNTPAGFKTFKRLAPGSWFNSVSREEYIRLYHLEVLEHLDAATVLDDLMKLAKLAGGEEPVLLCWEKPPFTPTNWCHRRMVAEWFRDKLGIDVPELGHEKDARQEELFTHARTRTPARDPGTAG